ncbi:MAG: 4-hydroxybenzoate octaprenyltransferase [Alphaproteobacteria bacterium MarineAlpha5_Bin8]|nr:MAG: 4-hydroxybenzoate octaprenyltransferase [Alphaproteobacteria bacterium MarineAlpha5_Bin7]PPR46891.1 MAG: 4-hydroxybenzoate octaprenyltransferase [Alphaproteobacteria bacterium MarineAlpha5_Bin8]PPR54676.1 MAG: 4-hydroxybenzoate octaprenyltransferase [Alphaproteobacteria bacterium MarineAlpha5_Bin6]|tara:strand:+ start:551 stop:1411 length:861 start_codon:yes stop_codon:yes gene_type:complete
MLNKIVPNKILLFFELIRFDKPIGFLLLMWPCWIALAAIEYQSNFNMLYFYFFVGAFLMRSAGCIINDLIDINIDKNIIRTSNRPLTSKKILVHEALILLFILLLLAFLILLQFNFKTILIGLISLPLIILYPYMKRITYLPQLVLGLVFNWGVFIVSIEIYNKITPDLLLLYIGCVFWTLAYDTIYAYQDIQDDIKNKLKSTAILFGIKGRLFVKLFYLIFLIIIGYLGYKSSDSILSIGIIVSVIFLMIIYLNKWMINSNASSNYFFKLNNYIGLFSFIYLIIF